jgi:hypothetical protein
MNERILELLKQSQVLKEYKEFGAVRTEVDQEKFAQLIVADAINTVEKRFMGDLNREDMEVRRCVEALKNHFGVYDEQR